VPKISPMKRFGLILALFATLAGVACSKSALTSGAAAMDTPANRACNGVKQLVQDRAAGAVSSADLRTRIGAIYRDAQTSENPLIRARAVALYAAATVEVAEGMASNLDADLAALNNLCAGGGVEPA
jgi:hypothetical protein